MEKGLPIGCAPNVHVSLVMLPEECRGLSHAALPVAVAQAQGDGRGLRAAVRAPSRPSRARRDVTARPPEATATESRPVPPAREHPAAGDPERPRLLPFAYFGLAHACLALACGMVAADPRIFLGPWYQGRTLAVVHLITLGWLTASILGAFYAIAPATLRLAMPVRRADGLAALAYTVGVIGMISHFWKPEPWGMVSSASLVAARARLRGDQAVAKAARLARLRTEPAAYSPGADQSGFDAGFRRHPGRQPAGALPAGLGARQCRGARSPRRPRLGGDADPRFRAAAHSHAAAHGDAESSNRRRFGGAAPDRHPRTRRRPPFLLGSRDRRERSRGGARGGVAPLLLRRVATSGFAMPDRAPPACPRPTGECATSAPHWAWLGAAIGLGLYLAWSPPDDDRLRFVPAYAAIGLLGFLGQMIAGVAARMLPIFVWLRLFGADLPFAAAPAAVPRADRGPALVLAGLELRCSARLPRGSSPPTLRGCALAPPACSSACCSASRLWRGCSGRCASAPSDRPSGCPRPSRCARAGGRWRPCWRRRTHGRPAGSRLPRRR